VQFIFGKFLMLYWERRKKRVQRSIQRLPGKVFAFSRRLWLLGGGGYHRVASRLAFKISGGMGDHILAARFIRDFVSAVGDVEFDVFCSRPGLANWIFKQFPGCKNVWGKGVISPALMTQYAGMIDVLTFADVSWRAKKGELSPLLAKRIDAVFDRIEIATKPLAAVIAAHPHLDGYLGQYTEKKGKRRHNYLHAMAGIPYGGHGLSLSVDDRQLQQHKIAPHGYITISNGFDEDMASKTGVIATKVYPHFDAVISEVKRVLPDLCIVQIGTATSTPIQGVDLDLISKTTLQEVAGLLRSAALHIDNEGGLVHLAAALGTRSAVVFGPTLAGYFGYEENINIEPLVCGGCWWMESTWMEQCVRGDAVPTCMYTQPPENVARKITAWLLGSKMPGSA